MFLDDEPIFHRPALAEYFISFLRSPDSASGVFLAAPRRTGKTTFIKEDLVPVLRKAGALVIYADLWEQKEVNPAIVIVNAIRLAIQETDGVVMRAARSTGLARVKVGGVEMDLSKIGAKDGDSISKTLQTLSHATNKPIIMMIDEAQHAQTTEEGRQTLFALKAARDAMKGSGSAGFRLLATGSNSDKLSTLVTAKDQAFFMAPMEFLQPLDQDYLQWVLDNSTAVKQPSLEALITGFEMCSHRPEPLKKVLRELGKPTLDKSSNDDRFLMLMAQQLESARETFVQGIYGMEPLDAAVLKNMAVAGKQFKPFDPTSMAAYHRAMSKASSVEVAPPTTSAVQSALERLRKEGLVWNAGRGQWYIEDRQHQDWIISTIESGPPTVSDDDSDAHGDIDGDGGTAVQAPKGG